MSNNHSIPDNAALATSAAIVAAIERSTTDSIFSIDLRNFTQPELLAFTLSSYFTPRLSQSEFVTPKIDCSVFNKSAGGRKQTYTRLRLAPPGSSKPANASSSRGAVVRRPDCEEEDNLKIIGAFKQLFNAGECEGGNGDGVWVAVEVEYGGAVPESLHSSWVDVPVQVIGGGGLGVEVPSNVPSGVGVVSAEGSGAGMKRKRGRPRKSESRGSENVGMELVVH